MPGWAGHRGRPGERGDGVEQDKKGSEEHIQRQAILPRTRSKPHVIQAMSPGPGHPRWHHHRPGKTIRKLHATARGPPFVGAGPYWLPCRAAPATACNGDMHTEREITQAPRLATTRSMSASRGSHSAPGTCSGSFPPVGRSRSGPARRTSPSRLPTRPFTPRSTRRASEPGTGSVTGMCCRPDSWDAPWSPSFLSGTGLLRRRPDGPRDALRTRGLQAGHIVDRPGDRGRAVVHRQRHRPRRPDRVRRDGNARAGRAVSRPDGGGPVRAQVTIYSHYRGGTAHA